MHHRLPVACLFLAVLTQAARAELPCPRCGWKPPTPRATVIASTIVELEQAIANARPGTAILLRDGTYRLRRMLDINAPGVMLRSASGDRDRVVIRGEGPTEGNVGVAVSVSASNVTIADLTIGNVGFHGVQVRGEKSATGTVLHEIHIVDTGQQLVKGSIGDDRSINYGGLISCSLFEYLDHAPSDYTNGVDILGGTGWVVRRNRFERIRGKPESGYVCGPTVLFWQGGSNAQVLDNVLVDCYRGIALGLVNQRQGQGGDPLKYQDHSGGVIRGNEVRNANPWADEAIEVNACPGALIEANTVMVEGKIPWSIGVRFPSASAVVRKNQTNRGILSRDGGRIEQRDNRRIGDQEARKSQLMTWAIGAAMFLPPGMLLGATAAGARFSPLRVLTISLVATTTIELLQLLAYSRDSDATVVVLGSVAALGAWAATRGLLASRVGSSLVEGWRELLRPGSRPARIVGHALLVGWVGFLVVWSWSPFQFGGREHAAAKPAQPAPGLSRMLVPPFADTYQDGTLASLLNGALVHGGAYFPLGVGLTLAWPRLGLGGVALIVLGLGLVLEAGQSYLADRTASSTHAALGALGAVVGTTMLRSFSAAAAAAEPRTRAQAARSEGRRFAHAAGPRTTARSRGHSGAQSWQTWTPQWSRDIPGQHPAASNILGRFLALPYELQITIISLAAVLLSVLLVTLFSML